jgi:hypothetical protein
MSAQLLMKSATDLQRAKFVVIFLELSAVIQLKQIIWNKCKDIIILNVFLLSITSTSWVYDVLMKPGYKNTLNRFLIGKLIYGNDSQHTDTQYYHIQHSHMTLITQTPSTQTLSTTTTLSTQTPSTQTPITKTLSTTTTLCNRHSAHRRTKTLSTTTTLCNRHSAQQHLHRHSVHRHPAHRYSAQQIVKNEALKILKMNTECCYAECRSCREFCCVPLCWVSWEHLTV